MLLSAQSIAVRAAAGMISPFVPEKIRQVDGRGVVSYGLGGAGYDLQLSRKWKVCVLPYRNTTPILDVKNQDNWDVFFNEFEDDICLIPPNSFALGASVERFAIPPDIMVLATGKSTYARIGINAIVTPLEPDWGGGLTIEITNNTPYIAKVYAGEGIIQLLFMQLDQSTALPYRGRYQNQSSGITMPSMEK